MSELKKCPWCGEVPGWHIGGLSDDILFFGCEGFSRCVMWSMAFTKPNFEDALMMLKARWNRRAKPDNDPLTLEELRGMDGEPVYITVDGRPDLNAWHMVRRTDVGVIAIGEAAQTIYSYDGKLTLEGGTYYDIEHGILYGKTWLAYRRKPEPEGGEG